MRGGGGAIGGAPGATGSGGISGTAGATCATATDGPANRDATVANVMKYFIEIT